MVNVPISMHNVRLSGSHVLYHSLSVQMMDVIARSAPLLIGRIKTNVVRPALYNSATYKSLTIAGIDGDDSLLAHFGLTHAHRKVDRIIEWVLDKLKLEITNLHVTSRAIQFTLKYSFLTNDEFVRLIHLSESYQRNIASSSEYAGEMLPWLEWLLTAGDTTVISTHKIRFHNRGRTGLATMVPGQGHTWRVPPSHAGVYNDNWLTRILTGETTERAVATQLNTYLGIIFR